MKRTDESPRFDRHDYTFGFLRLLFASLVIVSHTPELVDGNRDREILSRLTGTMSFGELAVNGFFIISGFLITGSFINSKSISSYLIKRISRIYPAFTIASLVSILVVAPLAGGYIQVDVLRAAAGAIFRAAILARPMIPGVFAEQHHGDWTAALNGPTWTIQYEFLCYLLVIIIGLGRIAHRPIVLLLIALILLTASRLLPTGTLWQLSQPMLFPAPFTALCRLIGMFLAGAAFHAFRHRLRFSSHIIGAAVVGLALSLQFAPVADVGFAIFGGYLIFAAAKLASGTWLGQINEKTDISYGVYLYAGPIEQLLLRYSGTTDLLILGMSTWLLAVIFGLASWFVVEKPALHWARQVTSRTSKPVLDRVRELRR